MIKILNIIKTSKKIKYLEWYPQDTPQDTPQVQNRETAILNYCKVPRTREEIQNYIGIKDRKHFREYILEPLLDSNKLSMTIPDKPNSKLQKYVSSINSKV